MPGEIRKFAARPKECIRKWQRIVGEEVSATRKFSRHAAQNWEIELIAVVRHEKIAPAELAKGWPDGFEVRRVGHIAFGDPVLCERPRTNRDTWLHKSPILVHHSAVPHSYRRNFNDLGAGDVFVGGLDVYRGKVVEGVGEGPRTNELRGLEQTKRET